MVFDHLRPVVVSALLAAASTATLAQGFVTPGGITEQGRRILDEGGSWSEALDAVLWRLRNA